MYVSSVRRCLDVCLVEDGFTVRGSGIKIGLLLWRVGRWGDWIGVYTGHGKKYGEVGLG